MYKIEGIGCNCQNRQLCKTVSGVVTTDKGRSAPKWQPGRCLRFAREPTRDKQLQGPIKEQFLLLLCSSKIGLVVARQFLCMGIFIP